MYTELQKRAERREKNEKTKKEMLICGLNTSRQMAPHHIHAFHPKDTFEWVLHIYRISHTSKPQTSSSYIHSAHTKKVTICVHLESSLSLVHI